MVDSEYDVVMVGAGGDGPAAAWKLGQVGLKVLILEAGPWHGHDDWPHPHEKPGMSDASGDPGRLSGDLLDRQFTKRELEMAEKLLWGPADYERGYWLRKFPGDGAAIQAAGVGGTTLLYTSNHPRAYPAAIDVQGHWDFDAPLPTGGSRTFRYRTDLVPYYQEVEPMVGVSPAPVTAKEELFFQGCEAEGWDLLDVKNVDSPGYRPQPNAVKQPQPTERFLDDGDYDGPYTWAEAGEDDGVRGSTLARGFISGNPHPYGAPFEEKAKRASNVSFVPAALESGPVEIRPNAFVTDVLTEVQLGDVVARGVRFRDTWSGTVQEVSAQAVVLSAGSIETPRLWLNAGLPPNEWVGKGMTIHFGDNVMGFWEEDELLDRLGKDTVDMHQGQNIAARFDFPGLGMLQTTGTGPGIGAILGFGASQSGFSDGAYSGRKLGDSGYTYADDPENEPWDSVGRLVGQPLKRMLADYRRTLPVLVVSDDRPHKRNGVSVVPGASDEHGPIPEINYVPSDGDIKRRDELARICARILRAAGADHIHRSDSPPTAIHIHGTMRMSGSRNDGVLDGTAEAHDVSRLFVADNSVMPNSLGGPNPTNTGQALAARTAEAILWKYFDATWEQDAPSSWKRRWN